MEDVLLICGRLDRRRTGGSKESWAGQAGQRACYCSNGYYLKAPPIVSFVLC